MAKKTSVRRRAVKAAAPSVVSDSIENHSVPSDDDLIASLAGDSDAVSEEELRQLFGSDLHELRGLAVARQGATKKRGARQKVYLLHGIMGSQLGISRRFWKDVIWLGLGNVIFGKLLTLRLGADAAVKALGFLPGVYLMMRLELEIAGFEVREYWYDWRQDIEGLGAALKKEVESEKGPVAIVAHSMGGLVTRAAFRQGMGNVSKFVMLAVPNHGSLAPVEALRGQYGLARTIAGVDLSSTAKDLADKVFGTFPGLYQMILARSLNPKLDLLDISKWPSNAPRPDAKLLELAGKLDGLLAKPADTPEVPWYLIAGINQPTKVTAEVTGGEFVYTVTNDGDGTVPVDSALLGGVVKTWFASASHGFFTNNRGVRAATVGILKTGTTTALSTARPSGQRGGQRVTESEIRSVAETRSQTRGNAEINQQQQLRMIFGEPETFAPPVVGTAVGLRDNYVHRLNHVTIGRKKQRRLEIAFYQGSITDVTARAYVLGTFTGVTPTGAAGAVDVLMEGAIAELIGHNMFGSRLGEVFVLPLARRQVRAEIGVFVGLGVFDEFKAQPSPPPGGSGTQAYLHAWHVPALEIAAENAARMLARTNVDDFATVMLGGTVARDMEAAGESMLRGFLRGVEGSDPGEGLRRLVICETDPEKYHTMRQHLVFLATTPLCEGVEFVLSELDPPPEVQRLKALGVSLATPPKDPMPAYLLVRNQCDPKTQHEEWRFALLGPWSRAAVREATRSVTAKQISALLAPVKDANSPNGADAKKLGVDIASELLPDEIRAELANMAACPLVILHDANASRIPWETLQLQPPVGEAFSPALTDQMGMSRRFLAASTVCSRWSTAAVVDGKVNVLLISNPTLDLTGAAHEANVIRNTLASHPRFLIDDSLFGDQATRSAILTKLKTGGYDIVHYCGHAYFDAEHRSSCGLICAGGEVLTGNDVQDIAKLPFLLFLNACQSNKVRTSGSGKVPAKPKMAAPPSTVAEAMLCSGIANFIGTYWPVDDDAAGKFAAEFYNQLGGNSELGKAMLEGRKAIADTADHSNYALFGNPTADFAGK